MESRRKISVALMLTYIFAIVLNAVVVLTCDCSSCHTHTAHQCLCEECAMYEDSNAMLSQHCECTHTHENRADTAVEVDTERVLKLMKVVVAELPRTLSDTMDTNLDITHDPLICPFSVPLEDDPLCGSVGLRAPPVFA